jgi:hypothetical protein
MRRGSGTILSKHNLKNMVIVEAPRDTLAQYEPMSATRRCLTGVDSRSKWTPEFVAIDEQPYDEIMHVFRLREAQRPTY